MGIRKEDEQTKFFPASSLINCLSLSIIVSKYIVNDKDNETRNTDEKIEERGRQPTVETIVSSPKWSPIC